MRIYDPIIYVSNGQLQLALESKQNQSKVITRILCLANGLEKRYVDVDLNKTSLQIARGKYTYEIG